jgi:hypothetical protein
LLSVDGNDDDFNDDGVLDPEKFIIAVFRDCQECGTSGLVLWTPDGPDPAPADCSHHSP